MTPAAKAMQLIGWVAAAAGTGMDWTGLTGTGGGLAGKPLSPNSGCSHAAQIVFVRNRAIASCAATRE